MSTDIRHTPAFDLAYRFVTETNANLFLTGKAGTGKTTFLKYLRDNCDRNMAVAAPTGVAAINAGGVTLHSMFQLPLGLFIPDRSKDGAMGKQELLSRLRLNRDKLNFFRNLELLIIDEASMVSCYVVDAIDTILRSVRRKHQAPFGGVQVLFIGDLYQLQPVVRNGEWELLKNYYSSIFFFDSHVLRNHPPVMIELKEIYRQKDASFVEILNEIRNNELSAENFRLLNKQLRRNFNPPEEEGYITLTTHNNQAKLINDSKLRRLPTSPETFKAIVADDFPEPLFPCDKELILKEGAQVMFTKNDPGKKYFNGRIGWVTELSDDHVKVRSGEDEITVFPQEWDNIRYTMDPVSNKMKEEILGTFIQLPLRLAWAITIHKSQGLTFDRLVIDAENAFVNGQVYVALSRATSLEGLVLTSPINERFLGAHDELKNWQEKNYDESTLEARFLQSRLDFCRNELAGIFTWKYWLSQFRYLEKIIQEDPDLVTPEVSSWLKDLSNALREMEITGEKFVVRIFEYVNQNPQLEENEVLQQRVRDAGTYFLPLVSQWLEKLQAHPILADKRKTSSNIDEVLEDVFEIATRIRHRIGLCKNGFVLNEYLRHRNEFKPDNKKIRSSYSQKTSTTNGDGEGDLYGLLADFRYRLSDRENLPLYRIFSNQTMKDLCQELPADLNSLQAISGFGNKKIKAFGEDVISIISNYCREKGLETKSLTTTKKKKALPVSDGTLSATVEATLALIKQGKNIAEVSKERKLVRSTIEGHLAVAIIHNRINIEEVLPLEELNFIRSNIPQGAKLSNVQSYWNKLPEGMSHGSLKMVLASMERRSSS